MGLFPYDAGLAGDSEVTHTGLVEIPPMSISGSISGPAPCIRWRHHVRDVGYVGAVSRLGAVSEARRRIRHRHRRPRAMVHAASVSRAPQPPLQPRRRDVERCVGVLRGGLRTDDRPFGVAGQLDTFAMVGLSWIPLCADLDIEASDLVTEAFELGELFRHVLTKPLGDLDVPTLDRDVHAATLALRAR
jgi:hypothetical protein